MEDVIVGLEARKRKQELYNYTAIYHPNDTTNDKSSLRDEMGTQIQLVYRVEVWADDIVNAITRGVEIVNLARAEEMTDYISNHPIYGDKDVLTQEEIKDIHEQAVDIGLFNNWLSLKPTSIQINKQDNEEILKTSSMENILKHIDHTTHEVEDFLKEIADDA